MEHGLPEALLPTAAERAWIVRELEVLRAHRGDDVVLKGVLDLPDDRSFPDPVRLATQPRCREHHECGASPRDRCREGQCVRLCETDAECPAERRCLRHACE